jgi:hypothetical protein
MMDDEIQSCKTHSEYTGVTAIIGIKYIFAIYAGINQE